MDNLSDESLGPLKGLSDDKIKEAGRNLAEFFRILNEWDMKEKEKINSIKSHSSDEVLQD